MARTRNLRILWQRGVGRISRAPFLLQRLCKRAGMMKRQRLLISTFAICLGAFPLTNPASAQLFGPSDEQKAQESDKDAAIKDLQNQNQQLDARVRGLEDKVRGLTGSLSQTTGSNEEL